MRWPWTRRSAQSVRLALSLHDDTLAYVLAEPVREAHWRVLRHGVERRGDDSPESFARRLAALDFKGSPALGMLRPAQYQIVQIEAPAVPPEELRTAARWQIRDMVTQHIDDLTLDVLKVGDEQGEGRASGSLFVVAGLNSAIRALMQTAQELRCAMGVIDVQDLAQRNLQSLAAQDLGVGERAHAAVTLTDDSQALLTICARGELFYTRRIDLGAGFAQLPWGGGADADGGGLSLVDAGQPDERSQRLVIEIQRTLDLWERTWPSLVLDRLLVHAGARSAELAGWLQQELGHAVLPLDLSAHFDGFDGGSEEDRQLCWPLLGLLLREPGRTP